MYTQNNAQQQQNYKAQADNYLDEATVGSKIDFNFLLLRQIGLIVRLLSFMDSSSNITDFVNGVDGLYYMLSPYLDQFYKRKWSMLRLRYTLEINKIPNDDILKSEYNTSYKDLINHYNTELAKKKFSLLMELMSRRNFLPEKQIIDTIGGDTNKLF